MKNITFEAKGFTLLEALLSLGILSFILAASFHFFHLSRKHFLQLKRQEEIHLSLRVALDKITRELLTEGINLRQAVSLHLITPLEITTNSILIRSGEEKIKPKTDLVAGQTLIKLNWPRKISSKRSLLFHDHQKGEIKKLRQINRNSILLASPLLHSYQKDLTAIILLREIKIFFDSAKNQLRIKFNTSSPQPLAEDLKAASFSFEEKTNLLKIKLISADQKDRPLETIIFLKNKALRGKIFAQEVGQCP